MNFNEPGNPLTFHVVLAWDDLTYPEIQLSGKSQHVFDYLRGTIIWAWILF